jgi:drug/metabolite transporter (DMT)-like permease
MTCDDFEVAIEKRRHGALGEPERTALERHLATCASCRAFDETVRRTEATMTAMSEAALSAADWAKVERGVRAHLARLVEGFLAMVLVAGVQVVLAAWRGAGGRAMTVVAAVTPIALAYGLLSAYAGRRLARLERGEEMFRVQLQLSRGRTRVLGVLRLVAGALAVLFAWQALEAGREPRVQVVLGVDAAILAAIAVAVQLVSLPRARRERAELEGMERR